MIVSASRRTDIPACYSRWFAERLRQGYVLMPNPFNPKTVSRIRLDREVVDCIVFWTKNPAPMLGRLSAFDAYPYYFQFTLNPYGAEIEGNLPPLDERIGTFKRLSDKIGKDRVVWRYDPVLTNASYDIGFHREYFARIASRLQGYTVKCMLGFIDHYRHVRPALMRLGIGVPEPGEVLEAARSFAGSARQYGIELESCTAKFDFCGLGISGGCCIDPILVERIAGRPILAAKDRNQRPECRCAESIDIGMYDSCSNGCIYCYAVTGRGGGTGKKHDRASPMMLGRPEGDEVVKDRAVKSLMDASFPLFRP